MPFVSGLPVRGDMDMQPYLHKNIVIIKVFNKYKIVYFGDNGIAINENFTKLFSIMISYRRKSLYFSLKDIQSIHIKRNGLKNQLLINDKVILTWYTVGKNSYLYEKMDRLVKECRRTLTVLRINPIN